MLVCVSYHSCEHRCTEQVLNRLGLANSKWLCFGQAVHLTLSLLYCF